jgi:hypothetical protein
MNKSIKQLVSEAGFCLWENEIHKPKGAIIDWSGDYTDEFEVFVQLFASYLSEEIKKKALASLPESTYNEVVREIDRVTLHSIK